MIGLVIKGKINKRDSVILLILEKLLFTRRRLLRGSLLTLLMYVTLVSNLE